MQFDAIVILAGGIRDDGELPANIKKRVEKGKELIDQKLAPRIIMSGKWSWLRRQPLWTEAEAMEKYALKIGIKRKQIYLEKSSEDTQGNAYYTKKNLLEPNKWRRIIVVTSDYHFQRAKYIFSQMMGNKYKIRYEETVSSSGFLQSLVRQVKERLQLITLKFFKRFIGGLKEV